MPAGVDGAPSGIIERRHVSCRDRLVRSSGDAVGLRAGLLNYKAMEIYNVLDVVVEFESFCVHMLAAVHETYAS